jgi:hypothetical protein
MAAKKKAAKPGRKAGSQNKTAFVLGLPRDLPAKEAVAKAKEAGIDVNEAYVYKVRSSAKVGAPAKAAGSAPTAKRGPGRPPRSESAGGAPSKTDFVRSLPAGVSYAEAAEKAKALGIELSKAYFYVLKSELKKAGKGGAAPKAAKVKGKPGPKPRAQVSAGRGGLRLTSADPSEQAVLDAVRKLGAERARELIQAVEKFERG